MRKAISKEIKELVGYVIGEDFQIDEFTYYVDSLMGIVDFARRNNIVDVEVCNEYYEVLKAINHEVFVEYKAGNLTDCEEVTNV